MASGQAKTSVTRNELLRRVHDLEVRLAESQETLDAIRTGQVDALVVSKPEGNQVYSLTGADATYRFLVQGMSEAAVTISPDGVILYCNLQFSSLTKVPLESLLGSPIARFVRESDRGKFAALLQLADSDRGRGELTFTTAGGTAVPVFLSVKRFQLSEIDTLCLVITDLTEQKRTEQILASEQLARSILEQAAEAIVVVDADGTIIRASIAAERLAAMSVLLKDLDAVFRIYDEPGPRGAQEPAVLSIGDLLSAVRQGKVIRGREVMFHRGDGQVFQLLIGVAPLFGPGSVFSGAVVTMTDLTEHKRAEQAAREKRAADALTAGLLRGQEEERRRLSQELHDGLNQRLAVLAWSAGNLLRQLPDAAEQDRGELRRLEKSIGEISEDVRRMSHELHPSIIEHLGLVPTLRVLCEEFEQRSGIATEFRVLHETLGLDAEIATSIYRVAQEALTNIAKHSQSPAATVSLSGDEQRIRLQVTDTGVGFDIGQGKAKGGLGLASIEHRVRLRRGRLLLQSRPGQGTTVDISLPLTAES